MIAFLDFEASSLGKHSFPIDVAWVFEDGRAASRLIRPAEGWVDWSAEAEAIHGISRQMLQRDGQPVDQVAAEMVEALAGHDLYASAPSWDGKWLSVLLRAGGFGRHALRLGKSDDAFAAALRRSMLANSDNRPDTRPATIAGLVDRIIRATEPPSPAHRALADAQLEWRRWVIAADASTIATL